MAAFGIYDTSRATTARTNPAQPSTQSPAMNTAINPWADAGSMFPTQRPQFSPVQPTRAAQPQQQQQQNASGSSSNPMGDIGKIAGSVGSMMGGKSNGQQQAQGEKKGGILSGFFNPTTAAQAPGAQAPSMPLPEGFVKPVLGSTAQPSPTPSPLTLTPAPAPAPQASLFGGGGLGGVLGGFFG